MWTLRSRATNLPATVVATYVGHYRRRGLRDGAPAEPMEELDTFIGLPHATDTAVAVACAVGDHIGSRCSDLRSRRALASRISDLLHTPSTRAAVAAGAIIAVSLGVGGDWEQSLVACLPADPDSLAGAVAALNCLVDAACTLNSPDAPTDPGDLLGSLLGTGR